MYNEVKGYLIELAKLGQFDVISHGCNCQSIMGAGIAPQMAKAFGCDNFQMEQWGPEIEKLGNIDWQTLVLGEKSIWSLSDADNKLEEPELTVVNSYTQFDITGRRVGKMDLDYEALTLCMRKINHIFKGKHIGLPMIGSHLAGGDWNIIKKIIQEELKDMEVTIVIYEPKKDAKTK